MTPSRPMRSRLGVWMARLPAAPTQSKRCWSVRRKRMLVRSLRAARARCGRAAAAPRWTKLLRVIAIRLHHELEAELQAARIAGAVDRAGAEAVDIGAGLSERRRIGEVERLGAELQAARFAQREALADRQVDIAQAGSEQDIAAGVSVRELLLHAE